MASTPKSPLPHGMAQELSTFQANLDQARRRTHAVLLDAAEAGAPSGEASVYASLLSTELLNSMEELQVAQEELRAQNDALLESHLALELEHRRYQTLFDSAPFPYIVTDLNGTIRIANQAASLLTGVRHRSLVGKPLASYVGMEARKQFRAHVNQLARSVDASLSADLAMEIDTRTGERIPVVAFAARSIDPRDREPTLLWMLQGAGCGSAPGRDRLRRRRRGHARVRAGDRGARSGQRREGPAARAGASSAHVAGAFERAKSNFFAVLSHELRTPLQAMFGFTELLAREISGPLTAEQKGHVERLERSQRHLLGLVNGILEFEKMSQGGAPTAELRADPCARGARRNRAGVRCRSQRQGDCVHHGAGTNPELTVLADRSMLQQVLLNLVTNAVKFTPENGRIDISADTGPDGNVYICVDDTGRGIPADKIDQIFEPFVQVSSRDSRSGAGLGLAISRSIAVALGGNLTVESAEGKGSKFHTAAQVGGAARGLIAKTAAPRAAIVITDVITV